MRARSALQIATRATPTSAKTAPHIPTIPQPPSIAILSPAKTINSSPTTKVFGSTLITSPPFGHCNNLVSNQEVLILISCFVNSQILQKLANLIKQHNSNRFAKILKRESAYEIKKRCFCKHLKSFESYSPNFRQFFQTSQC